jgi:hypothetical protein
MTSQGSIRILSVDDHPLFRAGVATVVKNQPDMVIAAEAVSGAQALQQFREAAVSGASARRDADGSETPRYERH